MEKLNLPSYSVNLKSTEEGLKIFDGIRKKFVVLTPEEWVRQHFIQYLIREGAYPSSLIGVESAFQLNRNLFRADILVHDRQAKPVMMVECKAPAVKVSQKTFDQIARYNTRFGLRYLVVTNGLTHYCCRMRQEDSTYSFLDHIPSYEELTSGHSGD